LEDDNYLVPDRDCGDCTGCCVELAIVTPELSKPAGSPCQFCTGTGCGIYAERPPVCRDYNCLWRSLPNVDESWRPDRSGVMMVWGDVPPGFPGEHAVDIMLLGPPETLETMRFASMIAGFIESGTATFLNVSRGPGNFSKNALMNALLAPAIAARDLGRVQALLRAAHAEMVAGPAVPIPPEQASSASHQATGRA
jgi:hypothetical protein